MRSAEGRGEGFVPNVLQQLEGGRSKASISRARLETNQNANTWCNLTRKWLRQLGLEESWTKQCMQAVDAQCPLGAFP